MAAEKTGNMAHFSGDVAKVTPQVSIRDAVLVVRNLGL